MTKEKQKELFVQGNALQYHLQNQCVGGGGPMDGNFLCASISVINPPAPVTVLYDSPLSDAMKLLQKNRLGCLLVVEEAGQLVGIFSERDFVLKAYGKEEMFSEEVSSYMTKEPVTITLDDSVAFALTLMSQGGFRHLPVVDDTGTPLGMVSSKLVIDYISNTVMEELLTFEGDSL
ncbi:CBS domain-containing protein [bacterium]|nr:CBS domain-containing protein [bacterium]